MIWLLTTAPLFAATYQDPARTTQAGMLEVSLGLGGVRHFQNLKDCEGDACSVYETSWGPDLRLGLRPTDFFGVWVQGDLRTENLAGGEHQGWLVGADAGIHLTLPRERLRPALSLQGSWHRSPLTGLEDAESTDTALRLEGALFLAWGDDFDGFIAYGGPAVRLWQSREVTIADDGVSYELESWFPVGVVLGGEVVSDMLGLPWVPRTPRLSAGLEARGIDAWGLEAWITLRY
jgi:hypothetical protein